MSDPWVIRSTWHEDQLHTLILGLRPSLNTLQNLLAFANTFICTHPANVSDTHYNEGSSALRELDYLDWTCLVEVQLLDLLIWFEHQVSSILYSSGLLLLTSPIKVTRLSYKESKMHPLFKLQNTSVVFDYSSDLGIRSCVGSMESSFYRPRSAIPVYRATYYCGQKFTWPPEKEWKAMQAKETELKRLAKGGKGRPPKVHHFLLSYQVSCQGAQTGNKSKVPRDKSHTRQAARKCKCRLHVCAAYIVVSLNTE